MFLKALNIIKLIVSYILSTIVSKPVHWGMPLGITIEPTNLCNLRCKECPTGMGILTRTKKNIDAQLVEKVLDELKDQLINTIFYFQGEPFINPDVYSMIYHANTKGIYTITSSNGHFFTEENVGKIIKSKLNRLIVSIDGTTQEIYEEYRVGGSLQKVLDGTTMLVEAKKQSGAKLPKVVFQFLVTAKNEHQIEKAKELAKNMEVNSIVFKTVQIYDFKNGSPLIPKNDKYSRYKKQTDGTFAIKSKLKNRCWRMWGQPVVTSAGDVVPCCFDKDAKYKMGNLENSSFKEIWKSKDYQLFRKKVFCDRQSIDICKNCTEGLLNVSFKRWL